MATDITLTPRLIYLEDVATTANASGETANVNVLGAAVNPVALNKIPVVLLTDFTQAANDVAAGVAGVAVGFVYYNTTSSALKTRMT
jgi:hypothetical protein